MKFATRPLTALLSLFAIVEVVPFAIRGPSGTSRLRRNRNNEQYGFQMKSPVFDEVCDTTGVTLKRFMSEVAMLNPELEEVQVLFGAIETACKSISNVVKRSQLPVGYDANIQQGEDPKNLDAVANDLLKQALRFTGRLGVLASEEEPTPVSTGYFYSLGILFGPTICSASHNFNHC